MTLAEFAPMIGVAVGAGGVGITSWIADRRKASREDLVYWRKERIDTYVEFASATKRYTAVLYRVAGTHGVDSSAQPMSLDAAMPLLEEAYHRRDEAFERVLLVAERDDIAETARAWVSQLYRLRDLVVDPELTTEQWKAAVGETNARRSDFHTAVRRETRSARIRRPQS